MTSTPFINQMEPSYDEKEINAVTEYLKSGGWIMEFKKTQELEQLLAQYIGTKYCVILPNGTLTLWAAMYLLGIGPGDEVILPDYTMVATINSIIMLGAKPVLVDIDEETLCIDTDQVSKAITKRTKAVIAVSINGRSSNMNELVKMANRHNIYLLEDAAQSLGSRLEGKHLGTFGVFGSFSFSMPKIITMGQGGALVTDDKVQYEKLKKFKDFGRTSPGKDEYDSLGVNLKFSDLQAVFGIAQMQKLADRVLRKKDMYRKYTQYLAAISHVKMVNTNLQDVSPWFIDILVDDPQSLLIYLKENGIGSRPFYPALHTLPYLEATSRKFPHSDYISKHGLWLPSSMNVTDEQIKYICQKIGDFYARIHH